jgi:hypothetical protein
LLLDPSGYEADPFSGYKRRKGGPIRIGEWPEMSVSAVLVDSLKKK